MNYKDLFSQQSYDYAKFRPTYPDSLFKYLASLCPERDLLWDCATGNGQAAVPLANYFHQVVATDASEAQLASAPRRENVAYRQARADASALLDSSVDMVTVFQALHWFADEDFFREVRRVTKPQGLLTATSYAIHTISPEVDAIVDHYYRKVLEGYWAPERTLIDEAYKTLPFPFPKLEVPAFTIQLEWELRDLVGYLWTWSATQTAMKALNKNPLEGVTPDLEKAWGAEPSQKKKVTWPLILLVGEVHD